MTTDAKIGLLLALVFIVAITFVINGLPDFLSKKDKTQDTASYINHYGKPGEPGIVDKSSRDAAEALNKKIVSLPTPSTAEVNAQTGQQDAAYQAILPAASEVVKSASANTPAQQTAVIDVPSTSAGQTSETIYQVSDGDSLANIALKFYGPQAGKKLVNIRKIFEANKKTLKSMDALQIGQKLIIPPLNDKEQALLKTGLFEKVDKEKGSAAAASDSKEAKPSKTSQEYVIKEQDTLWKIAEKYLGDGSRYEELAERTKSIDPENLVVGTKIKLPAK